MSSIKPFRAVHYNPEKIKDFAKVVCPPYDVISDDEQTRLYNLNPYNFINLELAKDKPGDDKDNNRYSRAKKSFEEWLKKGVLVQDEKPGLYFYKQEYKILGQKHSRLGFISLMELKDPSDSKIFPHENTHAAAVDDRFKLWKTLNANLSSIFVCYSDRQKKVEKIFNKTIAVTPPLVNVEDGDRTRHKLWRLDDPSLIKEIKDSVDGEHLFIADGHHRFKVANELRNLKLGKKKATTGEEAFNYVMTYFTNIDSPDLKIFPIHRIVKNLPQDISFLEENFRVDKIRAKGDLMILLAQAGRNEHAFGLYTRDGIRLLRLKNKMLIDEYVKEGTADYKRLDATILKYFVLDKLGIDSTEIIYSKDFEEVMATVDNKQAEAGFILNPVKISQLKAIALNGERMPPKTTYFYPKVLSGLTVYKLDN